MKTKKVLILQNVVLHYRKALYNELSKTYDVTVLHSGKVSVTDLDDYKEIIVRNIKIGPFFIQKNVYSEINTKKYDTVIAMMDLRWLNNILTFFLFKKRIKFIWWGAWFTKNKLSNKIRVYLTHKGDASIFYTEAAKSEFIDKGISGDKLFAANNTFDVGPRIKSFEYKAKKDIIFVGSLDKRKQLDVLINAFANIKNSIPKHINLRIVGGGELRQNLEKLVNSLKLDDRVFFLGKITNPKELRDIYKTAIASVSYGQAGLSVLQSFGFGVPFVTKINAISGGEKTNIMHGENGFFCEDNITSLEQILIKMSNNIERSRKLGEFAFEYYTNFCTIENMSKNIAKAIEV